MGVPALARVIESSRDSGVIDRVVVSTDSAEVAEIARSFGAEVHDRTSDLADDFSGLLDVVQQILRTIHLGEPLPQAIACVLPTAVLMSPGDLENGVNLVRTGEAAFVVSVGRFNYPVQRALRIRKDSTVEMVAPEHYRSRSQDLEPLFHDAGQMYVGTIDEWMKRQSMFDFPTHPLMIDDWRVQDIDNESDWERAELIWRVMNS
jgi:N-acylneuraminate cytidylyltransferase